MVSVLLKPVILIKKSAQRRILSNGKLKANFIKKINKIIPWSQRSEYVIVSNPII